MQLSYNVLMIVLDASAVILLAKIDLLEIFVSNFSGRVLIPEKVREEVCIEEMGEAPLIVKPVRKSSTFQRGKGDISGISR